MPLPRSAPLLSPHFRAALQALEERIPPERIDRIWLFAPRQAGGREQSVAVLSLFEEGQGSESARRHLWTLRYEAEPAGRGRTRRVDTLAEEGIAPTDRIGHIVAGVLRRLGEDASPPHTGEIAGNPERWARLVAGEGRPMLDHLNGE